MAVYTIDSVQDLIDLTNLSGKFAGVLWKDNLFNLTTDLDLTGVDPAADGKGWWPIGDWDYGDWFNGFFDGQGYTISNMTINRPNRNHVGLFGSVDPVSGANIDTTQAPHAAVTEASSGQVLITQVGRFDDSRVGMEVNVSFGGVYEDGWYVISAITGEDSIEIALSYKDDIESGVVCSVGKDSALTNNPIKNLGLIDVNITGNSSVGGMIGSCLGFGIANDFPVKNCYVTGTINASRQAGGFVGSSNNGYFLDCYTDVDIVVTSVAGQCHLGSFVGSDSIGTDCVNCYGVGSLTHIGITNHDTYVGGLCGEVNYNRVDNTGDAAVTQGAGGKVLITKAGVFNSAALGMTAEIEWGEEEGSGDYTDGWYNVLASDDDSILVDVAYVSDIASDVEVYVLDTPEAAYATDSFWDKTTTGLDVDGRGDGDAVGKTTVEMKQQATFTNWDFDDIWWITEGLTYPELSVFGANPNLPTQASNESPADDATDVAISATLSWSKDSGDNVLVYFDKKIVNDPPTTKVINDEDVIEYDPPSDLVEGTVYVWRVDTKNENGTTTGDQWEFTTVESEPEPEPEPEPESDIILVKGRGVLGSPQVTNSQIVNGDDFSDDVCPNGPDCDDTCGLVDVPNEYHPGTKDSIINF